MVLLLPKRINLSIITFSNLYSNMCNSISKIRQKQKNMQTLFQKYKLWHKQNENTFLFPWCREDSVLLCIQDNRWYKMYELLLGFSKLLKHAASFPLTLYNYCSNTDRLASVISLSCWQSLFLRAEISCWNNLTLSGSMPWELIWAARSFSTSAFNSENTHFFQNVL